MILKNKQICLREKIFKRISLPLILRSQFSELVNEKSKIILEKFFDFDFLNSIQYWLFWMFY